MESYELMIASGHITDSMLQSMANIMSCSYNAGSFKSAEFAFHKSNASSHECLILNGSGPFNFVVTFEQHESYLRTKLTGHRGACFDECRLIMHEAYVASGGNIKTNPCPISVHVRALVSVAVAVPVAVPEAVAVAGKKGKRAVQLSFLDKSLNVPK